jgi:hypothetical protein
VTVFITRNSIYDILWVISQAGTRSSFVQSDWLSKIIQIPHLKPEGVVTELIIEKNTNVMHEHNSTVILKIRNHFAFFLNWLPSRLKTYPGFFASFRWIALFHNDVTSCLHAGQNRRETMKISTKSSFSWNVGLQIV